MFKNIYKALLISPVLLGTLMIVPLRAQEKEPLDDTFNRAFYNSSGTYYDMTSVSGQFNMIFGWRTWPSNYPEKAWWPGSYPENQISEDGQTTEFLLKDVMQQQGTFPLRTRDLVNPYNTSVQENPSYIRPAGPL